MKGPIRVGVVGMSGIGKTHAASHKQDPLAKLVAVCDVVKEQGGRGRREARREGLLQPEGHAGERGPGRGGRDHRRLRERELALRADDGGARRGQARALREAALERHRRGARDGPLRRREEALPRLQPQPLFHPDGRAREEVHATTARSARRSTCCSRWASTAAKRRTASTSRRASTSPTRT